jgi:hypothetical protein
MDRHRLSLVGAAKVLGISRRKVAYYKIGERLALKTFPLACQGCITAEGVEGAAGYRADDLTARVRYPASEADTSWGPRFMMKNCRVGRVPPQMARKSLDSTSGSVYK